MLATKSLLKNGRYSIELAVSSGPAVRMYYAHDDLSKQIVAIFESELADLPDSELSGESYFRLQHDGLVRMTDNFQENNCSYSVSEPLPGMSSSAASSSAPDESEARSIFERLGTILLAMSALRTEFTSLEYIEISPETVMTTAEGKLKLQFADPPVVMAPPNPADSPYLPLERVWEHLDHIAQTAIYRTYDDESLAVLESPPDSRSDLYSLGAVFYKLLSGVDPLTVFERSIEMLDTRVDPLSPPSEINNSVRDEDSRFVMRMMELRRERRFGSIEDAIFSLPSIPQAFAEPAWDRVEGVETTDDPDVLEIPLVPAASADVSVNGHANVPVAVADVVIPQAKLRFEPQQTVSPIALAIEGTVPDRGSLGSGLLQIRSSEVVTASPRPSLPVKQKNAAKPIAFAAAAILALVVAGLGILNFGMNGTTGTPTDSTPAAAIGGPPNSASVESQTNIEPASTAVDQQSVTPETERLEPSVPTQSKLRPQIAEAKPTKTGEPKTAAKTDPKAKKKLTVDDLINDN